MPELGDQDVQKEYRDMMIAIVEFLDEAFNGDKHGEDRPTGFVLMVYPFANFENGDTRCNYMSNGADRRDVVTLMKEMIARFEGQPDLKGTA